MGWEAARLTRKKAGLAGVGLIMLTAVIGVGIARSGSVRGDEPGILLERRGVIPMLACDGCDGQQIRLYYIGLPAKSEPMVDARVRGAIWESTDPQSLVSPVADTTGNIGFAISAILPDQQSAYLPPHEVNPGQCAAMLAAAGYPSTKPLRFPLDVPLGDDVASALATDLRIQWGHCGIQVDVRSVPAAELLSLVRAGNSTAFLMAVDQATARPYGLLDRLYAASSPENYAGATPGSGSSLQDLLAEAKAATDPNAKADRYRQASELAMSVGHQSVLPLIWNYDIGPAATWPPTLVAQPAGPTPGVVTVGGVAFPRTPAHKVSRIRMDWGDGTIEDRWFPGSHTYRSSGPVTIIVTAYHEDGRWTARALPIVVTGTPGGLATSASYQVTGTSLVSANRWQASVNYSLDGTNDGHWRANVYYLNQCGDAGGKKLGTSDGVGGLLSPNGLPLPGVSGSI